MSKRIVVIGAGAVGGYAGAHMTTAGHDVSLIDPWPGHVERMRAQGLEIHGMTPEERMTVKVNAMHLTEVQSLAKQKPIDIAFVAVKSYDTVWATTMIRQYLRPRAAWFRCRIASTRSGSPGWSAGAGRWAASSPVALASICISRGRSGAVTPSVPISHRSMLASRPAGSPGGPRRLPRSCRASMLPRRPTILWGERWTKLCVNGMRNGVSAATGMGGNARDNHPAVRRVCIPVGRRGGAGRAAAGIPAWQGRCAAARDAGSRRSAATPRRTLKSSG